MAWETEKLIYFIWQFPPPYGNPHWRGEQEKLYILNADYHGENFIQPVSAVTGLSDYR